MTITEIANKIKGLKSALIFSHVRPDGDTIGSATALRNALISLGINADIVCDGDTAFATVRTVKKEGADVIFSVGKGAVEYVEQITALAKEFDAEVCCSRIVADSGKLPYEKQVGLTGRTVCPKVYVAFGISGAVQHTCAIAGAGMVIAVNTDKKARIFDYADYGIVMEVKNVKL